MLKKLIKNLFTFFLLVSLFNTSVDFRTIVSTFESIEHYFENRNIVDTKFHALRNKNVVDSSIRGPHQAQAALDSSELEYAIEAGPITGSTSANYVYASFFNPSGSGRTAVIKSIAVRGNAVAAATYQNLTVRRITAASGGTQITASNLIQKNTSSSNSIVEVRHTGPTVTLAGATQSRIIGLTAPGTTGEIGAQRSITFGANDEKIILQPGEGIVVYQEAAGDTDQRIRTYFEWEEVASAPSSSGEYLFAFQRIERAIAANNASASFLNPSGSGKTAIVKRIWFGSEICDGVASYTNDTTIRRITAASGGTLMTVSDVPKKHTSTSNTAMELRYAAAADVTVTVSGGGDARLAHVTPCGTTSQPSGWQVLDFHANDEKLILQAGEGIALVNQSATAQDVDQYMRMIVEWQEVDSGSTPTTQGEYIWASARIEVAAALGTTYYTFFNPSGSGKTAVVKRIGVRVNADTAATYSAFNFQRISAASGGTLVAVADLPKKHTGTSNSIMEARWCGAACASAITATYTGSRSTAASGLSDSGIFKTNGAGAAGQIIGQRELVFGDNEKFILQPGEGLGFYLNYLAGDIDQYVKIYVEWDEESSAPSSQGEYLIDIGPVPGNTGTSYNYASFFNPATSGKTAIINHIGIRIDSVAAATSVPMRLRRTTAASGGTQITAANIPKKHTSTADSAMEIRRTGVTVTYVGTNAEQFVALQTPTTVGAATAPSINGYRDFSFVNDANEPIVLRPGEGIALHHDTFAGDADFRVKLLISWEEVTFASTPAVENEYLMSTGPILGSLSSGYVYSTFFNPVSSGKDFSIKKIGIKANRRAALAGAGYIPLTIRPITAASGGTLLTAANIPKKNASTTTTTAEIRNDNVTVTLGQDTATRLMGVTIPGAVNQLYGDWEQYIYSGDDLILKPGQGLALYQESSAGDQSLLMHFMFEWAESDVSAPADSLTFSISDNAIGFGTLSASAARYATGDGTGSGTETVAHTVTASTNASSGYAITIQGATLTSGANTITSIGGASTASTVGTEQFGIRVTASGGDGAVVSPYNHATNYAYDATGSVSDIIASDADGDDVETTYSVRYIGNINAATEAGTYTSSITYVITANF